jgi:hypothetical protein
VTPDKESPTAKGNRVPILLDATMTVCKLLMIGSTAAVVVLSLLAKCDPLWLGIRAGTTLLVTGLLSWAICWIVSRGSLEAARSQMQHVHESQTGPAFLNKQA